MERLAADRFTLCRQLTQAQEDANLLLELDSERGRDKLRALDALYDRATRVETQEELLAVQNEFAWL